MSDRFRASSRSRSPAAGRPEQALEHVQRAIALESRFGELARDDDDLAAIRDRF